MTRLRNSLAIALLLGAHVVAPALAQSGYTPLRADANAVPALARTIALDLQHVTLADALRAVTRAADLELVFRADLPGLDRRVTLREARITAAAALLRTLEGSPLQALASATGHVVIVEAAQRGSVAPSVVTGTVREAGSGLAIAHVEITLGSVRTATDAAGRFRLRDVAPGTVTVTARRIGYHETRLTTDVGAADEIEIEMRPAPTPLAAVVVTPGHFAMLEQGIGSRQTLTRAQIETAPQLGDDIFRAVNRLPGVSSHDMSAAFGVRGAEHGEVLLRLDGLELLEPFHLKDFGSSLSIIDIGSVGGIDLITGGFGAEYGNRLTGVFDMRTLNVAPGRTRTSLGLSLTNVRAASQGSFAGDRGRWLVTARRGYLDLALRLGNGNPAISPTYYDVLGKVEYELGRRTVLSAHVLHAGDHLEYDDEPNDPRLESFYGSSYGWLNLAATPRAGLDLFTVLAVGRLGWERRGDRADDSPRLRWTALAVDDDRAYRFVGLRQDWSLALGERMLLKAGFDARHATADYDYRSWQQRVDIVDGVIHESFDTTRVTAQPEGTSVGAYVAHRSRPWQPLTVEIGAEYSRHSHTGDSNVNPRFNASLAIGRTTLRAAWGRYAQAQGLHELQVQDGIERFHPADVAEHRIISIEQALPMGLNVRLEAYERNVHDPRPRFTNLDLMDDIFPEVGRTRVLIDPERGRARGVELVARRGGEQWDWAASYALSKYTERINGELHPGPRDQPHAVGMDVTFAPNARWRMAAAWQAHTGWPMTPHLVRADSLQNGNYYFTWYAGDYLAQRVPTYHRLDLRVSRHFETRRGRVVLFADIWNVYNRQNARTVFVNVHGVRNGQLITEHVRDTMIPRIPSLGINWEF